MKTFIALLLSALTVGAQTSPYMVQLLQKPNAVSARAYLGVTNAQDGFLPGNNITFIRNQLTGIITINSSGGSGSGTVTSFSATGTPLFSTSVLNPTTTPALSFTLLFTPMTNSATAVTNTLALTPVFESLHSSTADTLLFQISPIIAGTLDNHTDVLLSSITAGDILAWSGTMWTNGPPGSGSGSGTVTSFSAGNGGSLFTTAVATATTTPALTFTMLYSPLASITNASIDAAMVTMIGSSNATIPSIKSISAGANITLTDNKTNVIITGAAAASSPTDLMQYQTNHYVTYNEIKADAATGSTAVYQGIGDVMSVGFSGGTGASTLLLNTNNAVSQGPWNQITTAATSGSAGALGTATAGPVWPITNGIFYFQTYVKVRNLTNIRFLAGFTSGTFSGALAADSQSTNQAMFRFSTAAGDTTWKGVCSDPTGSTVVDTGLTVVADTDYLLTISKTGTSCIFTANRTSTATANANVPNATRTAVDTMGAFVGARALANETKTNWVRYVGFTFDWVFK